MMTINDLKKDAKGKILVPSDLVMETRARVFQGACSILAGVGVGRGESIRFARDLHRTVYGFHDEDIAVDHEVEK